MVQGFQGEFLWQGTSDVSAWLAVPAALRVMRAVGLDTWRRHNSSLLHEAVALLSKSFATDLVVGALLHGSSAHVLRCEVRVFWFIGDLEEQLLGLQSRVCLCHWGWRAEWTLGVLVREVGMYHGRS